MPRRQPPTVVLDKEDILRRINDGLRNQLIAPNMYAYVPHEKQLHFHMSPCKKRFYLGGNRSGKTYGAVAEDIWWLTGTHPYIETPELPVRGRVVAVDFQHGFEMIIKPLFQQLLPKKYLKNGSWDQSYNKDAHSLTLTNGSTCEFMSYEQDLDKFAGTSRHFIHFDEEPPKHIFNECNARLIDTAGSYWISMTPVDGMTWVYEDVYSKYEQGKRDDVHITEVDMLENPHITPEAAEAYLSDLDDDERDAREKGQFVALGGLVYKKFHMETHVIDPIDPRDVVGWRWYMSLDHGYNNPTAVLWHAVSPDNQIITFHEYYMRERTVKENADAIKEIWTELGRMPDYSLADPAIKQVQATTGTSIQTEYAMQGIFLTPSNNDVKAGVAKVQMYLRTDPQTGKPFRQITSNCSNFIWEMKKLRWARYSSRKAQFENNPQEQIHKKDDHACDADRYFHVFLPDLTPERMGLEEKKDPPPELHAGRPVAGTIDDVLAKMGKSQKITSWTEDVGHDLSALEYE